MSSKHDFWADHHAAWSASGATQAAWCREHGLALSSFTYWRRKLEDERQDAPAPTLPATLPLRIMPSASTGTAEIRLTSGVSLSVPASDPVWLARLLREIGAC